MLECSFSYINGILLDTYSNDFFFAQKSLSDYLIWNLQKCDSWLSVNVLSLINNMMRQYSWLIIFKSNHDEVIKWKHFPCYWPFVRGLHRSPVNSLHKGQWRGALIFSLICVWINGWVNNHEAGDLRHYCAHYDVTVMFQFLLEHICSYFLSY